MLPVTTCMVGRQSLVSSMVTVSSPLIAKQVPGLAGLVPGPAKPTVLKGCYEFAV